MYELALRLGIWDVEGMAREMSSKQLASWQAFDQISPVGDWRGDYNAAMIASILVNVNKEKNKPAVKLEDFALFEQIKEAMKTDDDRVYENSMALKARIMAQFQSEDN